MIARICLFCSLFLLWIACLAQNSSTNSEYPEGEILGPFVWNSHIYPGTERNYWVYVPAQYDGKEEACVMVVQDGLGRARGWNLPQVLDSLIALEEVPVMIGIFVDHGKVPADEEDSWPRFNRCFEYDALGDRYASFLIEELLPEVGKSYRLSNDPNDRCIAGASSGAICAFNVAWERPDAFRRVLSTIGTYVGLRGGDEFPTLVRKTEPKPLRVFLEDGTGDLNIYAGDWWAANQRMLSALTWAGYEVNHIWGKEGHNSKGARKIMPLAIKWLWQDYPTPIQTHPDKHQGRLELLANEEWEELNLELQNPQRLAANDQGEVWISDMDAKTIQLVNEQGELQSLFQLSYRPGGIASHRDGKLYLADLDRELIRAIDSVGKGKVLVKNVYAEHMISSPKGLYWTDPFGKRVGCYRFSDQQVLYAELPHVPVGLALNPEQTQLNVSMLDDVFGYSLTIGKEGELKFLQAFTHYHIPYGALTAKPQGMAADQDNFSYTATNMGIQVVDPLGRVNLIYPTPGEQNADVRFGGKELDILFVISDGKLYRKKVAAKGVQSWQLPVKVKKPGL